jgi:type IV secretory pathway TraG/TraD family ATPase VirD4
MTPRLKKWARSADMPAKLDVMTRVIAAVPEFQHWEEQCCGLPVGAVARKPAYLHVEGHSLTIGQSGEGKFSSVIAPMLLHDVQDERGVAAGFVVVDPKNGEAARVTAGYRRTLREEQVYVIDPYGNAAGGDALNPFDFLDPQAVDFFECCRGLADALVVPQPKEKRSENFHWESIGAMWLTAMIAHLALSPEEEKTIRRLRSIFSQTQDGLLAILMAMEDNPASPTWVLDTSRQMQRVLMNAQKEASGYLATIYEATKFADSAAMTRVLNHSTFDPINVRTHAASVYLVAEDDHLPQCAPWLRLMCETIRQRVKRSPVKRRVHWVLDEAMAFGAWSFIEQGLRAMRGFDMSLHLFYQNVGQIRRVWGEGWTSITDARLIRFLGSNDLDTLEWIAKLCGEVKVVDYARSTSQSETQSTAVAKAQSKSIARTDGHSEGDSRTITEGTSSTSTQGESRALATSFSTQKGESSGWSIGHNSGWTRSSGTSSGHSFSAQKSYGDSSSSGGSEGTSHGSGGSYGPGGFGGNYNYGGNSGSHYSRSHSTTKSYGDTWQKSQSTNEGQSGGNSSSSSGNTSTSTTDGKTRTITTNANSSAGRTRSVAEAKNQNRNTAETQTEGETVTGTETKGATNGGSETYTERRRVMTAAEARSLSRHKVLVFVDRDPDCIIDRLHYFDCPPLMQRVLAGMAAFPLPEDD